jgi:hypothetical protein
VARLRGYWRWLGYRLRLSQPGRVLFTAALLVCIAGFADARVHGAGEGGAPLVVLVLVLAGVIAVDIAGRVAVALVRRLVVGLRRS